MHKSNCQLPVFYFRVLEGAFLYFAGFFEKGLFIFAGIYGANPRRIRPDISPAPGAFLAAAAGDPPAVENEKITVNLDFAIDISGKS